MGMDMVGDSSVVVVVDVVVVGLGVVVVVLVVVDFSVVVVLSVVGSSVVVVFVVLGRGSSSISTSFLWDFSWCLWCRSWWPSSCGCIL